MRASGRNRKVLDARDWSGVESVEADALMPDSLHAALAGVDTAYYLVHSMAAGQDFGRLDVQAAENFAAAADQAGLVVRPFAGEGVRCTVAETAANDLLVEVAGRFRSEAQG